MRARPKFDWNKHSRNEHESNLEKWADEAEVEILGRDMIISVKDEEIKELKEKLYKPCQFCGAITPKPIEQTLNK